MGRGGHRCGNKTLEHRTPGYNVRYRLRLSQSGNEWGDPWYVPGFGRNGGTTWGGTVNLTFDVGKSARNPRKESRK